MSDFGRQAGSKGEERSLGWACWASSSQAHHSNSHSFSSCAKDGEWRTTLLVLVCCPPPCNGVGIHSSTNPSMISRNRYHASLLSGNAAKKGNMEGLSPSRPDLLFSFPRLRFHYHLKSPLFQEKENQTKPEFNRQTIMLGPASPNVKDFSRGD